MMRFDDKNKLLSTYSNEKQKHDPWSKHARGQGRDANQDVHLHSPSVGHQTAEHHEQHLSDRGTHVPNANKRALKGRKRLCPYEPDDPKPIVIDNPLMGNFPDFSMPQDKME